MDGHNTDLAYHLGTQLLKHAAMSYDYYNKSMQRIRSNTREYVSTPLIGSLSDVGPYPEDLISIILEDV